MKTETIYEEVSLTGTVNSTGVSSLSTAVSGLVETLNVEIGDAVVQGDPLLVLDDEQVRYEHAAAQAGTEEARAQLAEAESLGQLVLARRGDSLIRLADVAEVRQGQSRLRELSYFNGQQGIGLQVRRESGANVIDIKRTMMAEVNAINRDILEPAGMHMTLTSDDARYVEASIATTILVFLPILFIEEEAGQLYSDVAISVSSAILVSMLIAVTLVPALCARLASAREWKGTRAAMGTSNLKTLIIQTLATSKVALWNFSTMKDIMA